VLIDAPAVPCIYFITIMSRIFWKIWWRLSGWKFNGSYPYHIKKMVLIIAPHTSWKDMVVALAARSVLQLKHIKFLGKKELFEGPFGWFFRRMGGIPVDRSGKHGAVEQVVEIFMKKNEFTIAISPEGTRKKVDHLRTGFYHIAKKAGVSILMIGLDFAHKQFIISEPFFTTGNEQNDFNHILGFFVPVKGKHPERGLKDIEYF
jgi:1-acyl-sn-glycerol-3-phosphate acyltransferase